MPQVSRNKLSPDEEEKLLSTFHLILAHTSHVDDMRNFLFSFLTATEQLMLAKRLAIVLLLKEGNSDTEIADALHVTRMTVGKLRYLVEARSDNFAITSRILQSEKLREEVREALKSLGGYIARAAGGRVKSNPF